MHIFPFNSNIIPSHAVSFLGGIKHKIIFPQGKQERIAKTLSIFFQQIKKLSTSSAGYESYALVNNLLTWNLQNIDSLLPSQGYYMQHVEHGQQYHVPMYRHPCQESVGQSVLDCYQRQGLMLPDRTHQHHCCPHERTGLI